MLLDNPLEGKYCQLEFICMWVGGCVGVCICVCEQAKFPLKL